MKGLANSVPLGTLVIRFFLFSDCPQGLSEAVLRRAAERCYAVDRVLIDAIMTNLSDFVFRLLRKC
jgi:hypothetical protein